MTFLLNCKKELFVFRHFYCFLQYQVGVVVEGQFANRERVKSGV